REQSDERLATGLDVSFYAVAVALRSAALRPMRVLLQPIVQLGGLLDDDLVEVRTERVGRQLEPGFRFRAVALDDRAGVPGELEHGRVLAQRMDEDRLDAAVAGVQHGVLEEASAEA